MPTSVVDAQPTTNTEALIAHGVYDDDELGMGGKAAKRTRAASRRKLLIRATLGYICSALAGVFGSTQYALVQIGKRESHSKHGVFDERFYPLGSWLALFGVSAVACTLVVYAIVALYYYFCTNQAVPRLQLRVMFWPGLGAGLCWSAGNIFGTLAVEMGGNAVTLGQVNTVQLVASGVWGLLWYKEIRGWHALAWVVAAIFCVVMVVLLGFEKAGSATVSEKIR